MTEDQERWAGAPAVHRQCGGQPQLRVAARIGSLAVAEDEAGVMRWREVADRLDPLLYGLDNGSLQWIEFGTHADNANSMTNQFLADAEASRRYTPPASRRKISWPWSSFSHPKRRDASRVALHWLRASSAAFRGFAVGGFATNWLGGSGCRALNKLALCISTRGGRGGRRNQCE